MGQPQRPDDLAGQSQVQLVVVVEVRELPSPIEQGRATGHGRRFGGEPFDRSQQLEQLLLGHRGLQRFEIHAP